MEDYTPEALAVLTDSQLADERRHAELWLVTNASMCRLVDNARASLAALSDDAAIAAARARLAAIADDEEVI